MVIKGSSRGQSAGDIHRLAAHLLAEENESVDVVEITGVTASDLPSALAEMRALSLGTRTRKSVYHASINVGRDETGTMDRARWLEAVDELERHLGLTGHARAVIEHRKHDRDHIHVVWGRIHPVTLRTASDSHNYAKHEACARVLEERFALRPVTGAHTRTQGTPRPRAQATHSCWQAAERTGIPVEDVTARIGAAWSVSDSGTAFIAALRTKGLSLASGRRGLLVVDEAGTPHSISRRLGLRAAQVQAKLSDIVIATVPTLDDTRQVQKGRKQTTMNKNICGISATQHHPPVGWDWDALMQYWRSLGYESVRRWDALVIDGGDGSLFYDHGGRIELHTDGEPTDEQIKQMVAAGKARGWESIRFYGGSESFQQRARLEALRQGFPHDKISLECEDGQPKDALASTPMPEHLRRRLGLPSDHPAEHTPTAPTEENQRHAPAPQPRRA
ncbi:MAG: relaxase/mobilization nuclease domain-containing protein [Magnetospirillum sp.]|nr:relaxase/mobilization nuclease domain-containing protein [Magnetospirillum sp.]